VASWPTSAKATANESRSGSVQEEVVLGEEEEVVVDVVDVVVDDVLVSPTLLVVAMVALRGDEGDICTGKISSVPENNPVKETKE
jgi:hypothetical protein